MGIAERRKREKEQRRNEIIDAAEKIFFANDYDSVTMDEVANGAEVNKALIYYYFENKEALFSAVYLRIAQMLYNMYIKFSKLSTNGLGKITTISWVFHEFFKDHPGKIRFYLYAGERLRNSDNEDAKKANKLLQGMWETIVDTFMHGSEEGIIRNDLDPMKMAIYISLISLNMSNIDPSFKMVLEERGFIQEDLWADLEGFMAPALTNNPYKESGGWVKKILFGSDDLEKTRKYPAGKSVKKPGNRK